MSRKLRFIRELSEEEVAELRTGMAKSTNVVFSRRCHLILLSHRGKRVDEIGDFFEMSKATIYSWFNRYEKDGIGGLRTKAGQGRKPKLSIDNAAHVEGVKKAVDKVNKQGGNLLSEVEQELGLESGLSAKILRCFLKKTVMYGNAPAG